VSLHLTREKLFETARTLPPGPKVLARLGVLLEELNVDVDEVTDHVKIDPALAARIVRMSNSVIYGGHRIGDIEEAVSRVGFREVHRLVGVVTSDRLADRDLRFYQASAKFMRENMLFTAIAAEALADFCDIDPHQAYTAGLLRPLGMLVLDRLAEHLPASTPYDHGQFGHYLGWEAVHFGLPNTEVAALVLDDWRFPRTISDGIRCHYLTKLSDYENRMACLLNLASLCVAESSHTLPGDRRHWELTQGKLDALEITEDMRLMAADRAASRFSRLRNVVN